MLVIVLEMGSAAGGLVRWAGRRHDDDRADATSGSSPPELADVVFRALHDGEQVALGLDRPLAVTDAAGATGPGLAELAYVLGELGTWRPWTTVSTSLAQWRANTSILAWQAVPAAGAAGAAGVSAPAAADGFFRQFRAATSHATAEDARRAAPPGPVVNLAAAAARQAGLFVDPSELTTPPVSIPVPAP